MRFDYYWRHHGNYASMKYKQNGYEIERWGYLLFFGEAYIPCAMCRKAFGARDMGEPKNYGGGKA